MRFFLPLFSFFILVFIVLAGQAQAQSCPRSNPETIVKKITYKTKYYRGTSAWFLTAWAGHWGKGVVLGLHTGAGGNAPFGADYKIEYDYLPVRGNAEQACIVVKKITMRFFIRPVVHIAAEYPPKSCEFKEVLKHEKKHVKVTKEWQKEYTPMLRRELASIGRKLPAQPPAAPRSLPAIDQAYQNIIKSHLQTFMEKKAIPDYIRRQNKVDDPLEYRLVPTRCENWEEYHLTAYQEPESEGESEAESETETESKKENSKEESETDEESRK